MILHSPHTVSQCLPCQSQLFLPCRSRFLSSPCLGLPYKARTRPSHRVISIGPVRIEQVYYAPWRLWCTRKRMEQHYTRSFKETRPRTDCVMSVVVPRRDVDTDGTLRTVTGFDGLSSPSRSSGYAVMLVSRTQTWCGWGKNNAVYTLHWYNHKNRKIDIL